MRPGDTMEQQRNHAAIVAVVREALESLLRDGAVSLNAERLKVVVDTTREIKEQLVKMNGRVRENEKSLVAIEASPPLTREHCDTQREDLAKRLRVLEGRVPSIVQNLTIAFITGGVFAVGGYLLGRLP